MCQIGTENAESHDYNHLVKGLVCHTPFADQVHLGRPSALPRDLHARAQTRTDLSNARKKRSVVVPAMHNGTTR